MGCLKLDIEHTYTGLKVPDKSGQVVYGGAVNVSRGSGKNEVETNYYYFGEQGNKSQVNLAFGRRETEQSQSPVFDKVESQHFGVSTKCLCGKKYYDPRTSQWLSVDPLAGKYPNMSPYNYCAGNPVKFIDPDGRKIIFVNGYLGFGSPQGGATYWNGENSKFVNGAKRYYMDNQVMFTDIKYNLRSSVSERMQAGREWAKANMEELTKGLDKNKDDFKFVAHSMGVAFSEGAIEYLKK